MSWPVGAAMSWQLSKLAPTVVKSSGDRVRPQSGTSPMRKTPVLVSPFTVLPYSEKRDLVDRSVPLRFSTV
jgi:hypothetical protein